MSNLKLYREAAGLPAHELAYLVGVSPSAICHWEHDRRTPNLDLCRKLLIVLNKGRKGKKLTVDDIFPPHAA